MKSKEELNILKAEVETISRKLSELTEEELAQVIGGTKITTEDSDNLYHKIVDWFFKIKS